MSAEQKGTFKYPLQELCEEVVPLESIQSLVTNARSEAFRAVQNVIDSSFRPDLLNSGDRFAAQVLAKERLTMRIAVWMVMDQGILNGWSEENKRYFLALVLHYRNAQDRAVVTQGRLREAIFGVDQLDSGDKVTLDYMEKEIKYRQDFVDKLTERENKA